MMKRTIFLALTLLFLIPFNGYNQSLNKILKKHFKAKGQKELLKVNTITTKGQIYMMGMGTPYTMIQKRPDKSYVEAEVQGNKMKQAFDGEKGWMIAPWTGSLVPRELKGAELKSVKNAANIDGDLYNWEEKGYTLRLQGIDSVESKAFYNLELTKTDGDVTNYYIDPETWHISQVNTKSLVNEMMVEVKQIFSEYKAFGKILVPTEMEMKYNGQTTMNMSIDSVSFNEAIDDETFKLPE